MISPMKKLYSFHEIILCYIFYKHFKIKLTLKLVTHKINRTDTYLLLVLSFIVNFVWRDILLLSFVVKSMHTSYITINDYYIRQPAN